MMLSSAYTIDVGECRDDQTREVYVKYHQQICFSTTHRDVLRVCMTRWHVAGPLSSATFTPTSAASSAAQEAQSAEKMREQKAQEMYSSLLNEAVKIDGGVSAPLSSTAGPSTSTATAARESVVEEGTEYLCVFHREELADPYGRYTLVQPNVICTTYNVRDGTSVELVLHDIQPKSFSCTTCGIFIRGRRQSNRAMGWADRIDWKGETFSRATDVWWMGSPLTVKPVYMAVEQSVEDGILSSVPVELRPKHNEEMAEEEVAGWGGSSNGTSEAAAIVSGGRTAEGQFYFGRSGTTSPTPYSPIEHESGVSASLPSTAAAPPAHSVAVDHRLAPLRMDGTVLSMLSVYSSETGCKTDDMIAVVRTGPEELRLARTTVLSAMDLLLWQWLPQRLRLSGLPPSNSALTVVVSEHPSMPRQLLFLFAAHHRTTYVLQTPHLRTGEGEFAEKLKLERCELPFVLPCLHVGHPAPVAVCNYPKPNHISLFDVVSLAQRPTADNTVVSLNLAEHQQRHPESFSRNSRDAVMPHSRPTLFSSTAGAGGDGGREDNHALDDLQWREEVASRAIHSILYQYHNRVVLQYLYPSPAKCPMDTWLPTDITTPHPSPQTPDSRRRRCEGTVQYVINFPSITCDREPLLVLILEVLEAALGVVSTAELELTLLRHAWATEASGSPCHFLQCCIDVLTATFAGPPILSHGAPSSASNASPSTPAAAASPLLYAFSDPSMVTLAAIDRAMAKPPKQQCTTATAAVLNWSTQTKANCLVALHLLHESCKIQAQHWPFLLPLGQLNWQLSMLMRWRGYSESYEASRTDDGRGTCTAEQEQEEQQMVKDEEQSRAVFQAFLSDEEHRQWSFIVPRRVANPKPRCNETECLQSNFCSGIPPSLLGILSSLVDCETGEGEEELPDQFPLWPLLHGLSNSHPVSVANRLVLLYQESLAGIRVSRGGAPMSHHSSTKWWATVCQRLLFHHFSAEMMSDALTVGVAYPILEAARKGRDNVEVSWPPELLALVGRLDCSSPSAAMALQDVHHSGRHVVGRAEANAVVLQYRMTLADDDGVSVRPDFRRTWRDSRLDVAQRIFNTAVPISLAGYEDRPEDLIGAVELLSSRARALPLGRGLLTMCTQSFKVQDSIPIPPLVLDGRTNDGICIVNKTVDDVMWPLFHNGCAAGLRFLPLPTRLPLPTATLGEEQEPEAPVIGSHGDLDTSSPQTITRQWVMYQTKNIGNAAARAGLLLATGILGHLTVLKRTDIFFLLISRQEQYVWREATTIAIMLGLSCSFQGTSNDAVFRCLTMHVQSLTPSAEDIEVSLDVQTAALVSMGLLCQSSPSNSFLVEVFLSEISRLPTDEHCAKREGYALGAGLGLGQLLLGVGRAHGIPHVEDRLLAFINGASRDAVPASRDGMESLDEVICNEEGHLYMRALLSKNQREASESGCTRIYEGRRYNAAVSGPAAVVALGLMYLRTDNSFVAEKITPPDRRAALQGVTPLLCLLRSMMTSLIQWSNIAPSRSWLLQQVPSSLRAFMPSSTSANPMPISASKRRAFGLAQQQLNYLLMNMSHCLTGHIMALGLRYAGTMDADAREVILAELQGFLSGQIGSTRILIPSIQRTTGAYELCILSCTMALTLVMAGTGDLRAFTILQHFHRRTKTSYGVHAAVSMCMGFLFLGSGRLTLSNSTTAVAALVAATYPVWPRHPEDNEYHLQALRHLYATAVVPRVMEAVDAITHQPVSVPVRIILRKGRAFHGDPTSNPSQSPALDWTPVPRGREEQEVREQTPCLYPPVDMIERIEVRSTQHYPLVFSSYSAELTDVGMVFRVMAKDGYGEGGPSTSLKQRWPRPSPTEARVLDWVNRLFQQQFITSTTEAVAILDNINFLTGVQRRLVSATALDDLLLSLNFGEAVEQTLGRRYQFIFLHDPSATQEGHPLYWYLMEEQPLNEVVLRIAEHPHGTKAFPCNFTALGATAGSTAAATAAAGADASVWPPHLAVDLRAVERWMREALHFYGLTPSIVRQLRRMLRSYAAAQRPAPSPTDRLILSWKLQRATRLNTTTLDHILRCCIAVGV